jgi:sugar phosphate isomerase/epimerase
VILTRPALLANPDFINNTYPSGHVTVAISLGLAAVIVAPPALRGLVALLAAIGAAGFGVFVVTAGWHLPSDALGAYAITLGVAAAVMAAVYGFFPDARAGEREAGRERGSARAIATRLEVAALLGAVGLFAGAIVFASLRYGGDVNWQRVDAAFLAALAAIVFAAGITVAALLRGLSLDDDQIGLAAQPDLDAAARGRTTHRTSRRVPQ